MRFAYICPGRTGSGNGQKLIGASLQSQRGFPLAIIAAAAAGLVFLTAVVLLVLSLPSLRCVGRDRDSACAQALAQQQKGSKVSTHRHDCKLVRYRVIWSSVCRAERGLGLTGSGCSIAAGQHDGCSYVGQGPPGRSGRVCAAAAAAAVHCARAAGAGSGRDGCIVLFPRSGYAGGGRCRLAEGDGSRSVRPGPGLSKVVLWASMRPSYGAWGMLRNTGPFSPGAGEALA